VTSTAAPAWLESTAALLTPRRLRAHAIILAVCLWGVCIFDFAPAGIFDRAENIKFQDFLQFPISARLIAQGRADELYNDRVLAEGIREITGSTRVELKYFYGPQVALAFVPFGRLSFLTQAGIWVVLSLLIYFSCVYLIWRSCPALNSYLLLVALCSIAYPPLFHFFVRGQLSAIPLLFFTMAYLAFRLRFDWLAGVTLGCLVFKPQFLVAIPLALLGAKAWKPLAGLLISAGAQVGLTYLYFGPVVMRAYFSLLLHSASHPRSTELNLSAIQMHSLHSFWELLLPWSHGLWALYLLTSLAVIALAAAIWRSSTPLAIRFSALILAAVLVSPHIYIYDLLALSPLFLLVTDWSLQDAKNAATPALRVLLYLAFLLPLFGPLARWTHLQLSVPVFATILWALYRLGTRGDKLAIGESYVV
jgi:hypothetical protein